MRVWDRAAKSPTSKKERNSKKTNPINFQNAWMVSTAGLLFYIWRKPTSRVGSHSFKQKKTRPPAFHAILCFAWPPAHCLFYLDVPDIYSYHHSATCVHAVCFTHHHATSWRPAAAAGPPFDSNSAHVITPPSTSISPCSWAGFDAR
jgi:hypothetical protein